MVSGATDRARSANRRLKWIAVIGLQLFGGAVSALGEEAIPWQEAESHVGRRIALEGVVREVRRETGAYVLAFAVDDPTAVTVKLVVPLLDSTPVPPETLYRGQRIRATGKLKRFRGHPELIVRGTSAIVVLGVEEVSAPTPGVSAPTENAAAPAPVGLPESTDWKASCEAARDAWSSLEQPAKRQLAAMAECLESRSPRCEELPAMLKRTLDEVEAAMAAVDSACERGEGAR